MKTLILTEKPSVARDFAFALGVPARGQGYFEDNNTIITWAVGHLLELKSPEEYDSKWKRWDNKTLPIMPERLLYKPNSKLKSQFTIVKKQLKRSDLEKIIIATDAGREGELIGRTILNDAKAKVDCYRFWTSQALSPSVIKEAIKEIVPLSHYDRLYYAGRARQSADWLVGMNLSRLATINMGDLYSIGRVQTAVLSLIVERDLEIKNFKPTPYYQIQGHFQFTQGDLKSTWFDPNKKVESTRLKSEADAKKVLEICKDKEVSIFSTTQQEKKQAPPSLFSLTELQKVANRIFGLSAKDTLSLAQALYEKHKCLSYPRTDSKVLGTKSLGQVKKVLEKFKNQDKQNWFQYFDEKKVSLKNYLVFNDKKLTDHHALIPLSPPKNSLSVNERKIFDLIVKRFIAAFSSDYRYTQVKITSKIENEHFQSTGMSINHLGWKHLSFSEKEIFLPQLQKGDIGLVKKLTKEDKTTLPPNQYTEATLLQDMVNPSRMVEENELKKIFRTDVGLGTQATRAQIIETLLKRTYIERNQKNIIPLQRGHQLISTLRKFQQASILTSPKETAKWELELEKIANGEGNPRVFMENIRKFVSDCVNEWKNSTIDIPIIKKTPFEKSSKDKISICPICKGAVTEMPKSYSCENWKSGCKFTIWKKIAGKVISKSQACKLIKKGKSDVIQGFKSKAGKRFSASLSINEKGETTFIFN